MKWIEKQWRDYVTRIYSGETMTNEQYQDLRRTFYAGEICMLEIFLTKIPFVSQTEGAKIIGELRQELSEFKEEIRKIVEEENG